VTPLEITSYRLRLETAEGRDLEEIVGEIVDTDTFPAELAQLLATKIASGAWLSANTAAAAVAGSGSRELYQAARSRILKSTDDLIMLFEHGFQDQELEQEMCKVVFAAAKKDAETFEVIRGMSVREAMKKHGGRISLQALQAITYTFEPLLNEHRASIAQETTPTGTKEDSVREFQNLDLGLARSAAFLSEVREAIDAIQKRLDAGA
jgi:hypothetical protein